MPRRNALERLLRSALPSLQRYLRHLIGPDHVDDISQDVLIIVCRQIRWLRRADLFRLQRERCARPRCAWCVLSTAAPAQRPINFSRVAPIAVRGAITERSRAGIADALPQSHSVNLFYDVFDS